MHHAMMVCKPALVVPPQYLGLGLHSRGKHGSPRHGDQAEDEGEESVGCRGRVQQSLSRQRVIQCRRLQLSYRLDSEDDAQPAPRAPNKVRTCRAADACAVTDSPCAGQERWQTSTKL